MTMQQKRHLPPQLKATPFLGPLRAIHENFAQFLLDNTRAYGDAFTFKVATQRIFFFNNPDIIRDVLQNWETFRKAPIHKEAHHSGLGHFLGAGILSSDGDFWKSQRKLIQPSFHAQYIHNYGDIMVHYTHQLLNQWRKGAIREIEHDMMQLTLNIATKSLFDVEVDYYDHLADAITQMQYESVKILKSPMKLPHWMPTLQNIKIKRLNRVVDEIIYDIIETRQQSGDFEHGDLLSMLMLAKDEDGNGMSKQQLRDEVMTLFVAGHETTALSLSWLFYLLSQNPQVQQQLYDEIDTTIGKRTVTLADLRDMPYLNMVIDETLRLYPVGWLFVRFAAKDVRVGDYDIKQGDLVLSSPYVLHRDPRAFIHPEQFNPDRFSAENKKSIGKYAYLPFGGGPRVCIGNNFAIMEMQIAVATIAQHYTLELMPNQQIEPEPLVTMRPKYGIHMRLCRRA